jgi:ATP-dependent Lon protease
MTYEINDDTPFYEVESTVDEKIIQVFGNLAIDKRRLPMSQLSKKGIPAYVAEWVLDTLVPGNGELTASEATKVQTWASKYLPSPDEANIIKNRLLDGQLVKILTPVNVEVVLNRRKQDRVGKLSLIGISDAYIPDTFVQKYRDLLNHGMWGVTEIANTDEGVSISSFKPMQAIIDLELYKKAREEFSLSEWQHLLLTSMGYDPNLFNEREKIFLLTRMLPLVQKNLHIMELAPKGTGKSYIYENISPKVRLVSGGNVSPAVLFVNNASGQWGLLARFQVVVLDEVQTLKFEKPEEIIGGLKGFLANSRLTRGGLHETSSDCSLVLLANIVLDSKQRPVNRPIVKELPEFLRETAFLDRLKGLIPGWYLPKLDNDSFAKGVGLKADFFGDALLALREDLECDQYCARRIKFKGDRFYKRNDEAVKSLASGMMKLLFPHGEVSDSDFEHYCVSPAVTLRQLIWDQLQILDAEYRQYEERIRWEIKPNE